jgi:CBS domain containing-hemolysin-like protein
VAPGGTRVTEDLIRLAAAFALVLACGLFVAGEFSLLSVNRTVVSQQAKAGDHAAKGVLAALRSLTTMLSGAQVGITLTNLAIGFLAEPAVSNLLAPQLVEFGMSEGAAEGTSGAVALLGATVVTMVYGELIPQYWALAHPLRVARAVQRPVRVFTAVTRPLSGGLNTVANRIVRNAGVEPVEELAHARTPEELVYLVQRSAEQGVLNDATADLLRKVLTFDDKRASDVMTPRTKVSTVQTTASLVELLDLARQTGRTRFPVVGDAVDDVRGVVSVLDAFGIPAERRGRVRVSEVASPAFAVPSVLPVDDLLDGLLGRKSQLALVIDEFGGLDGVVSLEDLVEELVGPVVDEHDLEEAAAADTAVPAGENGPWTLSGLLRPDEVRDLTGVEIPDGGQVYETLGGLILASLGRLPVVGDEVGVGEARLRVSAMDGRRVDRVELTAPPPAQVPA